MFSLVDEIDHAIIEQPDFPCTLMQLQQYNSNKFKRRDTFDLVTLKIDESVLMYDFSIAHSMNSYFSSLFATGDNMQTYPTHCLLVLLTRNLYTVIVILVRSYVTI